MGWYDPPDDPEPVTNHCPTCVTETPHTPYTKSLDSMGCINAICDVCGSDNLVEIVDPDHARDVRDDR